MRPLPVAVGTPGAAGMYMRCILGGFGGEGVVVVGVVSCRGGGGCWSIETRWEKRVFFGGTGQMGCDKRVAIRGWGRWWVGLVGRGDLGVNLAAPRRLRRDRDVIAGV